MEFVSAPQPGPLKFLANEHVTLLSQRFVPEGIGCTWVQQALEGVIPQKRSVPDEFGCALTHQTLLKEGRNQRLVVQKDLHQLKIAGSQTGNVNNMFWYFKQEKTNDLWRKNLNSNKGKVQVHPNR